jgi:hypothetical protein
VNELDLQSKQQNVFLFTDEEEKLVLVSKASLSQTFSPDRKGLIQPKLLSPQMKIPTSEAKEWYE